MKEQLIQLSTYNTWATGLLLDVIATLPQEKQHQELANSFNSLYRTVLHMWNAESIWWQRMKLQERFYVPAEQFKGDMKALDAQLREQGRQWKEWVAAASEPMLRHEFKYHNSKRESFKQPIYQMLLHVFNHGTYHRGQLVAMLRQLGVDKIPATDFIVWSRKKSSKEA